MKRCRSGRAGGGCCSGRGPGNTTFFKSRGRHAISRAVSALIGASLLLLASAVVSLPASALTTYRYTGNPFTIFGTGLLYGTADYLTGEIYFVLPLAPNLIQADVTNDVGYIWFDDGSQNYWSASHVVSVSTNSAGEITEWFVEVWGGAVMRTCNGIYWPPTQGGQLGACEVFLPHDGALSPFPNPIDSAENANAPGSWQIIPDTGGGGLLVADAFETGPFLLTSFNGATVSDTQTIGAFDSFAPTRTVTLNPGGTGAVHADFIVDSGPDHVSIIMSEPGDDVTMTWNLGTDPADLTRLGTVDSFGCFMAVSEGTVELTLVDTLAASSSVSVPLLPPQNSPLTNYYGWLWSEFPGVDITSIDRVELRVAFAPDGSDYRINSCYLGDVLGSSNSMYSQVIQPSGMGPPYPSPPVISNIYIPLGPVVPPDLVIPPDPILPLQSLSVSLATAQAFSTDITATLSGAVPLDASNSAIEFTLDSATSTPAQITMHFELDEFDGTTPRLIGPPISLDLPGPSETTAEFWLSLRADFEDSIGNVLAFDGQILHVRAGQSGLSLGDASIVNVTSTGFDLSFEVSGANDPLAPFVQMTWSGTAVAAAPAVPILGVAARVLLAVAMIGGIVVRHRGRR